MILRQLINRIRQPNHTWRRFANYCLNFIAKSIKSPYVFGLPESVLIEPTNLCSLKCPLCPTGSGKLKRKKGILSLEDFKKIIDEIGDYIYSLALSNYGEPFLNPDIVAMVSYAKHKKITTSIVTNAQSITAATAAAIVDAGLDTLVVSLDGTNQDTYEKYRIGGQLSKVIDSLKLIVEAKNKKNRRLPLLHIQFMVMKHNEDQIEQLKGMAKELKADRLILKKVCNLNGFPLDLKEMEEYMAVNKHYRAYRVEAGLLRWNTDKPDRNFCPSAWVYPAVNWDGSLYPCCFDYDNLDMGNVFEAGFKNVWNNKDFLDFRSKILKDKSSVRACADCPVNFYSEIIADIPLK
jgi:radical SAM protein with 4Fe4S-binding SPASM domain